MAVKYVIPLAEKYFYNTSNPIVLKCQSNFGDASTEICSAISRFWFNPFIFSTNYLFKSEEFSLKLVPCVLYEIK